MIERDKIHARFKDAPWYAPQDIIVGGVGGIGSWLTLLLSRADHKLFIFDEDTVDFSNLGGQLYGVSSLGKKKTAALKDIIKDLSDNLEVTPMGRYLDSSPTGNIVFSCFDNMSARRLMVEKWMEAQQAKKSRDKKELNIFIDARLEAETGIIYIVNSMSDYKRYMEEMFDDSVIPDAPCTFRATSHNAAMIASQMVSVFNNALANKLIGHEVRETPFKIEYELPTLGYKTIS